MVWYRALPEGLPRRLYEYLEKRRYHKIQGEFTISEEVLYLWLPVLDKHTTQRRKTLAKIAQPLIEQSYLKKYRFDPLRRHCIFTYASQYALPIELESGPEMPAAVELIWQGPPDPDQISVGPNNAVPSAAALSAPR